MTHTTPNFDDFQLEIMLKELVMLKALNGLPRFTTVKEEPTSCCPGLRALRSLGNP